LYLTEIIFGEASLADRFAATTGSDAVDANTAALAPLFAEGRNTIPAINTASESNITKGRTAFNLLAGRADESVNLDFLLVAMTSPLFISQDGKAKYL
jgi:hypothetical protein